MTTPDAASLCPMCNVRDISTTRGLCEPCTASTRDDARRGLASGHLIEFMERQRLRDLRTVVSTRFSCVVTWEDAEALVGLMRKIANDIDKLVQENLPRRDRS